MSNYNTNHLQREIESLRRQLMKEREESHYDVSVRLRTVTAEVEARILERCIVECMEEANAPLYSEEERIAILTATERLKEMRAERVKAREEQEHIKMKEEQQRRYTQALAQSMTHTSHVYRTAIDQAMISGKSITHGVMDEAGDVRWSKGSKPEVWL
jgi:GTPase Era involved in 16S rRNA processing